MRIARSTAQAGAEALQAPHLDAASDRSISSRLVPYLFLVSGASMILFSLALPAAQRSWVLVPSIGTLGLGLLTWRVDWVRVPISWLRLLDQSATLILLVNVLGCPSSLPGVAMVLSMLLMWTGFSLKTADLLLQQAVGIAVLAVACSRTYPGMTAVISTVAFWLLVGSTGLAAHWLRTMLDRTAANVLQAQREVADVQARALAESEQSERRRAEAAAADLAERSRLQQLVAEQAAQLATAASQARTQTTSVVGAAAEMSSALQDLTRTAQATDQITTAVAAKAQDASSVMRTLETTSAKIMAASDVIQSIAEQTNLLALNATIESARAGETGRGFAVVANEVKDLARQSGENADAISRTLAEVQGQVALAVGRVGEITQSMEELSGHNGALAAAVEEQSSTVRHIADNVRETATQVGLIADGVQQLEGISRGSGTTVTSGVPGAASS